MTTTSISSLPDAARPRPLHDWRLWAGVLLLGGLFVTYHHVFLQRTWMFAMTDRNWSHVLVVPLISLFYIYQHRGRLAAARFRTCAWGLPILFLGLFGYAFGIYPVSNDMAQGYSVIVALFGAALWLLGPAAMRVLWFPIAFLVFAVKVSDRIWSEIAWQLQQIAAEGATLALKFLTVFLDFDVAKRGATIELILLGGASGGGEVVPLNIAEACSGLRMLMAFVALATAMAFLWPRAWWQRLAMVVMAVPIAVFVNVVRVTVLGLVAMVDPNLIEGVMHTYIGISMLLPAAALFWLLGWVLERCVIREEHEAHAERDEMERERAQPRPTDADVDADAPCAAATVTPGAAGASETSVSGGARLELLGAALGIGVTLVAGLVYAGTIMTASPRIELPGLPAGVSRAMMELAWTLGPPALIAGALAAGAMHLLRRRSMGRGEGGGADGGGGAGGSGGGRGVAVFGGYGFVAGVLLTMAVGHGTVLAVTRAVLIKDPLPLRHSLWMLPNDAGSWVLEREDPPLSPEMLETLGTRTYLSRVYRDTDWPADEPGATARLHVAYYTGTPDTVPHVPERCFVAAGLQGIGQYREALTLEETRWRVDPAGGYVSAAQLEPTARAPSRTIEASRFTFAHPARPDRAQNVFYFFIANGQFLATPDMVRLHGFDPTDRYSYYAKVEIQLFDVADGEKARRRAEAMMNHLLPEILACLPDWHEVEAGTWPTPEAAARARRSGI